MGTAIRADSGTNLFIEQAHRVPKLTREQEEVLIRAYREQSDKRAGDRLVEAHLRDVVFIALRYRFYGVPVSELIAEGNLGLMRALAKFDGDRGTRFSTYAAYWIRAFVLTYILRSLSLVGNRSGVVRTKLFFKLRRERARLQNLHGQTDEADDLLAERLGMSREKLDRAIRRIEARDVSLDAPIGDDSQTTMLELLRSDDNPEHALGTGEVRKIVSEALETVLNDLDSRERFIVESRLLAETEDELSLADIGRKLGVSRERARQLETRARQKLSKALTENHGISLDCLDSSQAA